MLPPCLQLFLDILRLLSFCTLGWLNEPVLLHLSWQFFESIFSHELIVILINSWMKMLHNRSMDMTIAEWCVNLFLLKSQIKIFCLFS